MFDAWGKLPSGILSGNMYEFGNFDQCLEINHEIENVVQNNNFVGQYCLTQINIEYDVAAKTQKSNKYERSGVKFKGIDTRMLISDSNR